MEELKFKNGSTIKSVDIIDNVRGKRSELIGFYCNWCKCVHMDYPIKDIIILHRDIYCNRILEEGE